MATAACFSASLEKIDPIELAPEIFGVPVREPLLHDVVLMQLANRRRGCASTKSRSDVRGGGLKPWKQKGTGRARVGSRRSPLWRGGSTIFGPKPHSFEYRVPRSARRGAIRSVLSLRAGEGRVLVVEELRLDGGKTRALRTSLARLGISSALVVCAAGDHEIERAARNLPTVKSVEVAGLNVFDVLKYEHLVLTKAALGAIHEKLARS
ncbi:MAG: 50S ribosomal protein L4 [Deltaproteobacteria bacterium]|jgi:large subunit ribosomal protein L4|nr:50S ribosomal protein L4 [Deltaproteobacteria bacterium]